MHEVDLTYIELSSSRDQVFLVQKSQAYFLKVDFRNQEKLTIY